MIQILGVFFDWSEISFGIINGIYSVVIRIYNIMLGLVNQENMDMSQFENIATTMYVLAGVFILFKVVIAMVQMILNPDLVTDKQAGAGKLITRIVTCLIMLIAFSPNGFLFGYEGLFSKIEKAVLADDGLINNIINVDLSDQSSSSSGSTHDGSSGNFASSSSSSFLIENVYAANPTTCYYYRINEATPNAVPGNTRYELTIKEIYKIYFYYDPKNTSGLKKAQGNDKVYYKFSEARIGGENGPKYENGKSVYYNKLGYRIKVGSSVAKTIKNSNCPKKMTWDTNVWEAKKYDLNATELGLHGGTKTLKDLKNAIWNLEKTKAWKIGGDNPFVKSVTTTDDTMKNTNRQYLSGVEPESITFGQAVASSVQECASGMEKQCADAQQKMFATKEGNDDIIKLAGDKDLDLGFIVSTVAGIGLIIYLLFLCVEVIIRRFKLFFLEVLAPIPIISYVDPKDKTFNTWFKMYISTYLDLFIKLIAISIALALVKTVAQDFWNTGNVATGIIGGALVKFFYIVAILVFAKILPSMISKIFNLDSMGGSFKDIMGMAKGVTRAGMGVAGAAVGAGAGMLAMGAGIAAARKNGWKGMLGAGVQGLGNIASGAARGAGSGWNRNITGGASNVLATGKKQRDARDQGATMFGTMAARATNALGFDDAYEKRKKALDKEREDLKALQNSQNADKRKMGLIDQFEDKVVSNFDKGKYDHLAAVDAYNRAVSHVDSVKAKERLIGTMMKDSNGNDVKYTAEMYENELTSARTSANSMKGQALDAAKDYEIKNGSDTKAQELVGLIGTGSWKEMDQEKKSLTKSTINRGQEISISEERIAAAELELENSSSKFNHEAANRNSNN